MRTGCGLRTVVKILEVFSEKLLLALAIPSEHQDLPVKHEDVTVLNMTVGANFKGEDIENKIS